MPWQHDWWFAVWSLHFAPDILSHLAELNLTYLKVFYPLGMPIGSATQLIFASLASYPLLQLFSLEVASNLLIILSLAASGCTSYMLASYILGSRWLGLIAGWIFMSSPVMVAQASSHLLLLTTLWAIPLYILYLLKTIEHPSLRHTILLSCSAIVLCFGFLYYLNMLFIFTVILIGIQLLRKRLNKTNILHLLAAFLLFCPALVVTLPMLLDPVQDYLSVSLNQINFESVDLLGLLLPDRNHFVFGAFVEEIRAPMHNNHILHSVYIGWIVVFLSIIGLLARNYYQYLFLGMAILFTLLSLGPSLHIAGEIKTFPGWIDTIYYMPYMLYHKLFEPFVISDCSMFCIPGMLCWSIAAGFGLKHIKNKISHQAWRKILLSTACLLLLLDFLPKPHDMLDIPQADAYSLIADDRQNSSVLLLPYRLDQIINLYYQTKHEKNMLNPGYPRRLGPEHRRYAENFETMNILKQIGSGNMPKDQKVSRSRAEMFRWFFDLEYIILQKQYLPEDAQNAHDLLQELFDARLIHEDEQINIYKLIPAPVQDRQNILPIMINFDGHDTPVLKTGWSRPEQQDQSTWQWSNRPQSRLLFKVPGSSPLEVTYRAKPRAQAANNQKITIQFNDFPIKEQKLKPGFHEYQFLIPEHLVLQGHHSLIFQYSFADKSGSAAQGNAEQSPAVAFEQLSIQAQDKF